MPERLPEYSTPENGDAPPAFGDVVSNLNVRQHNLNSSVRVSGVCDDFLVFDFSLAGRTSGILSHLLTDAKAMDE